jgi:hypothetical protein
VVAEQERQIGGHLGPDGDAPGGRIGRGQFHHIRHDVREPDRQSLRRRSLYERTDALDDAGRPLGVTRDVLERLPDVAEIGPTGRQQRQARGRVVHDRGERLVQLVGEGRGDLADGRNVGQALPNKSPLPNKSGGCPKTHEGPSECLRFR